MYTKLYATQYDFRKLLICSAFSFASLFFVGNTDEIKISFTFSFLALTPISMRVLAIWSSEYEVAFLPRMSFVPPWIMMPSGLLSSATSAYVLRWTVVAPLWANLSMNAV